MLNTAVIGNTDTLGQASERAVSFGPFVRSIVGLDRAAAKQTFAKYLDDKRYTRNQIDLVNLVINYLTQHGTIHPGRMYDSPFTAIAPLGPESILSAPNFGEFFTILQHLHDTATAAHAPPDWQQSSLSDGGSRCIGSSGPSQETCNL